MNLFDSDSSTDSEEADSDSKTKGKKHKHSSKDKIKSGRRAKIADTVIKRLVWPHSALSLQFVSKDIKYEKLDIALFVAGFLESYRYEKINNTEIKIRTELLTNLMYLSKSYEWPSILDFHASVLVEIKRGYLEWGDDFSHLERRTVKISDNEYGTAVGKSSTEHKNKTLFCKSYNHGNCDKQTEEHYAYVKGNRVVVSHICAYCFINSKTHKKHPESECPSK